MRISSDYRQDCVCFCWAGEQCRCVGHSGSGKQSKEKGWSVLREKDVSLSMRTLSMNTLWSARRRIQLCMQAVIDLHLCLYMWHIDIYCYWLKWMQLVFFSSLQSASQCDNCGIEPIQGVRWHCQDCPQEMSLDFCDSCSDWWVGFFSTCFF